MAAAIPAVAGLGGSLFSGLSGKGAAKRQQKLAEQQMAMLKPLIEAQIAGSQYALGQSKGFLGGAQQALTDLGGFWRPLAFGDRSAIDQFLAPERRSINQGYQAAQENLARFAPRGGGRVSSLARADIGRQGQLSDLVFGSRREGASQMGNLAQLLGSLGTSTLSAGLQGGQSAFNLLGDQQNRAFQANQLAGQGMAGVGQSLGRFLDALFNN
jgi:hypothetical protein